MSVPMSEIAGALRAFFEEHNWNYTFRQEENTFRLSFDLSSKLGELHLRILAAPLVGDPTRCGAVLSYATPNLKADAGCMAQVSEYLHRINLGVPEGHFELDPRNGEIRFKHYVSCEVMPGKNAIFSLVSAPIISFEHFGNGLLAVSMGLQTPEEAFNTCRQQ